MADRLRVAVLCGGKSAEHEVSLRSARNIIEAMDRSKYEVLVIGIDKDGQWRLGHENAFLVNADDPKLIALNTTGDPLALVPGDGAPQLVNLARDEPIGEVDVAFPVLHGPFGEDGAVQGLLKLAGVPFVGAGVLGSAVGMDKDVMKRLLRDAGLPIGKFRVLDGKSAGHTAFADVADELGLPVFVKPANLGSSVGVSRATDEREFSEAVKHALRFDRKVILEQSIEGREIECSVLGNAQPIASMPGEIVPLGRFYSYEAKYIDDNGADLRAPADLPAAVVARVQELAIEAFRILDCEGLARVDFFLRGETEVIINEINTIPGFTRISMYPRLWEATGISCSELIDRLIELAMERARQEAQLRTSV